MCVCLRRRAPSSNSQSFGSFCLSAFLFFYKSKRMVEVFLILLNKRMKAIQICIVYFPYLRMRIRVHKVHQNQLFVNLWDSTQIFIAIWNFSCLKARPRLARNYRQCFAINMWKYGKYCTKKYRLKKRNKSTVSYILRNLHYRAHSHFGSYGRVLHGWQAVSSCGFLIHRSQIRTQRQNEFVLSQAPA